MQAQAIKKDQANHELAACNTLLRSRSNISRTLRCLRDDPGFSPAPQNFHTSVLHCYASRCSAPVRLAQHILQKAQLPARHAIDATHQRHKMSKLAFDYSKWDNIEISDDEADTHPNIDKASWFRMKHRSRVEREETEKMERVAMEKENKADSEREREIVRLLAEVRSGGDARGVRGRGRARGGIGGGAGPASFVLRASRRWRMAAHRRRWPGSGPRD